MQIKNLERANFKNSQNEKRYKENRDLLIKYIKMCKEQQHIKFESYKTLRCSKIDVKNATSVSEKYNSNFLKASSEVRKYNEQGKFIEKKFYEALKFYNS